MMTVKIIVIVVTFKTSEYTRWISPAVNRMRVILAALSKSDKLIFVATDSTEFLFWSLTQTPSCHLQIAAMVVSMVLYKDIGRKA